MPFEKSVALWLYLSLDKEILSDLELSVVSIYSYLKSKNFKDEIDIFLESTKLHRVLSFDGLSRNPIKTKTVVNDIKRYANAVEVKLDIIEAIDEICNLVGNIEISRSWGDKRGIVYQLFQMGLHPLLIKETIRSLTVPPINEIDFYLLLKRDYPYTRYSRVHVLESMSSYYIRDRNFTKGSKENTKEKQGSMFDALKQIKGVVTEIEQEIYNLLTFKVEEAQVKSISSLGWVILLKNSKENIVGADGKLLLREKELYSPYLFRWLKNLTDRYEDLDVLSLLVNGAIATWILQMGDTRVISKYQDKILLFLKSCALLSP